MKKVKLLALFLALVTVVSAFAACGGGADTTVADDETELADNTDDTTVTSGDETDAPETLPVVVEPEPSFELVNLDFETELALIDYIAATEGIAINDALNGGEIKDGKWVYSGKPMAIKDEIGFYTSEYYSVEFDFCFNSFVNKDNTSVFSLITDDDGVLNGDSSSFYIPLKMDMNGIIYHNSAKNLTFQVETGKVHHYKLEVDNKQNKVTVYVDGNLIVSPTYKQDAKQYQCFRFMDNSRGADMWVDNIVVTDMAALKEAGTSTVAKAVDAAYTRGGSYASQPQGLAEGIYVDMKKQENSSYCREGFLKFDISRFNHNEIEYALLYVNFANLHRDSVFDIYWVDSNWDSATLTYNNMPIGEKIVDGVNFSAVGSTVDFAPYIKEALLMGEKYFSIRITPVNQPTEGQSRLLYTNDQRPVITVYDELPVNGYFQQLTKDEAKNKEIWDYAQRIFDEWYERYQNLPAVNEDAVKLGRDESQYTKTNYMSGQSTNYDKTKTAHKSRPFEALTDFDEYVSKEFKNAKLDKYGGIMIESLKQKATGYFYTTKIDGRWWMIDPLGYPYISIGLSDVHYSQLGSKLQKENALKLYGDYDTWARETNDQVVNELYFNNSFRPVENIRVLEDGMPFGVQVGLMSNYGKLKGIMGDGNGSTVFTENNTMPVFDPDFVTYAEGWAKTNLKYGDYDRLIGYMSDNELPMNADMLDRALSVNHTKDVNWYTYACAWTWLCNMTGKENPSLEDVTDELRDLYRGFVWDKYLNVASAAIKKVDPNHMYLGTRFLTISRESNWVYRFAALYLDCMTINWYGDWEPNAEYLYGIAKNGDLPFIVTEFYTKAGDSGLGNTSGAGRFVATQTDRADFYETFVLRLLETQNCVGWQWFQYMDNDPNSGTGDASSVDSNKGIYRSDFTLYTTLTDRMAVLNKNVYNVIDYFANKNAD